MAGFGGYLDEYLTNGVLEKLGLSFDQWMQYPYSKQKAMIAGVSRFMKDPNNQPAREMNELERFLKLAQEQHK